MGIKGICLRVYERTEQWHPTHYSNKYENKIPQIVVINSNFYKNRHVLGSFKIVSFSSKPEVQRAQLATFPWETFGVLFVTPEGSSLSALLRTMITHGLKLLVKMGII